MTRKILRVSILSLIFIYGLLYTLSYAQPVIQWNEAHNYIGQHVTVEGKIVATYNSGKACFLNFHPDYKKHFTAVIFRSDFHKFPANPEDYYYGKKVHVTGVVKEYKGKPEIILKNPSQIKIIEAVTEEEPKIISWKNAGEYIGKVMIVEGKIVTTYNSGKACFLNFHPNWKRYFTAVIFKSDFHKFPSSPENYYRDKVVRVRGLIKEYKGKPEIIVKRPSQIEIVR